MNTASIVLGARITRRFLCRTPSFLTTESSVILITAKSARPSMHLCLRREISHSSTRTIGVCPDTVRKGYVGAGVPFATVSFPHAGPFLGKWYGVLKQQSRRLGLAQVVGVPFDPTWAKTKPVSDGASWMSKTQRIATEAASTEMQGKARQGKARQGKARQGKEVHNDVGRNTSGGSSPTVAKYHPGRKYVGCESSRLEARGTGLWRLGMERFSPTTRNKTDQHPDNARSIPSISFPSNACTECSVETRSFQGSMALRVGQHEGRWVSRLSRNLIELQRNLNQVSWVNELAILDRPGAPERFELSFFFDTPRPFSGGRRRRAIN
jgi:hypothetical protein